MPLIYKTIANLDTINRFKDVPNLDFLDIETRKLAITYLIKASNQGQKNANFVLGEYYIIGKYVKKDVTKGKELIEKSGFSR